MWIPDIFLCSSSILSLIFSFALSLSSYKLFIYSKKFFRRFNDVKISLIIVGIAKGRGSWFTIFKAEQSKTPRSYSAPYVHRPGLHDWSLPRTKGSVSGKTHALYAHGVATYYVSLYFFMRVCWLLCVYWWLLLFKVKTDRETIAKHSNK
jgi:hypothetical protein